MQTSMDICIFPGIKLNRNIPMQGLNFKIQLYSEFLSLGNVNLHVKELYSVGYVLF